MKAKPLRVIELGAGTGTFSLELARRLARAHVPVELTLVDRLDLVTPQTTQALKMLDWSTEVITSDVFDWLEHSSMAADVIFANLFLHHFKDQALRSLLQLASARTKLFMACEPRRSALALAASRLLWWCGCNVVTRHDAPASVRAGFAQKEISALWPAGVAWQLDEGSVGLFSHCLVAKRRA